MNKTDRKNKTNLTVTWPTHGGYFTIKDLMACNPEFIEITLRVRLDKAIKKDKTVEIIGYKNTGKGRPTMVIAMTPVSNELREQAVKDGILHPDFNPTVQTVMNVSKDTTPISTSESTDISIDNIVHTESLPA